MGEDDCDIKAFIDNGHQTVKACSFPLRDDDFQNSIHHFEFPTLLTNELCVAKYRRILKEQQDNDRGDIQNSSTYVSHSLKFFKDNINKLNLDLLNIIKT